MTIKMKKLKLSIYFVLFTTLAIAAAISTPDSPTYTAGVVEFYKDFNNALEDRLAAYLKIIHSKEAEPTDIIVFPEATLNNAIHPSIVPDPKHLKAPCDYDNGFLKNLSCAARTAKKYIVVNIIEKEICSNNSTTCSKNEILKYNTNVVFNRNGTVISRYRKWNLFGEFGINVTKTVEHGVFDTDFGVKFGHFICFDILFQSPAMELVRDYDLKDIIFPTMWFSELPFFSSVQVQSAWAYANDVNLLAAGANHPSVGSTGTGIYAGRDGIITATMTGKKTTKIYVAEVIKKNFPNKQNKYCHQAPQAEDTKNLKLKSFDIAEYSSELMIPSPIPDGQFVKNENLCHGDFCCSFNITYENKVIASKNHSSYGYQLVAYSGSRTYYGNSRGYYKACAVIACTDSANKTSCGHIFKDEQDIVENILFKEITIHSEISTNTKAILMPNSLTKNMLPLDVENFRMDVLTHRISKTRSSRNVEYSLRGSRSDLLTFGFYLNEFEQSGGNQIISSTLLIIATSIFSLRYLLKLF